jgi:RNA polymerase sigma factor (sigma-70 family)
MANNFQTERYYLRKLVNGDESAFRYFIKTYQDMAFTLAVSIVKDEFVAQEIAQDAFINAFKHIKSFNGQSAFKTWFYRIVVNQAFAHLKKIKKDFLVFCNEFETDMADSDLENLQQNDKIEIVNNAFKLMPPNESLVLRLFYLEEESIKEVAAITGWTDANIKVLLHRGRKRMLGIIQQQKHIRL